jgi:hypothetical protein
MKKLLLIIPILLSLLFFFYLALPNPPFPLPPEDCLQSDEPADTETPLRRAYFTNLTREEVISHYQKQLERAIVFNLFLPTYRLNYPPEEAGTIIRDQTRSTFLEEIVHPLRESIYINGFKPSEAKDAIFIGGRPWEQKIIIKYVPSKIYVRLGIALLTIIMIYLLSKEWLLSVKDLLKTKNG